MQGLQERLEAHAQVQRLLVWFGLIVFWFMFSGERGKSVHLVGLI